MSEKGKCVLVPLAEGFEEIEAITIIDILRRAGAEVITAALTLENTVMGSHEIAVEADTQIDSVMDDNWDMVVLPGGVPGSPNLAADVRVIRILKMAAEKGKYTAAICAAPAVLEKAAITKGKKVTSAPGWADRMISAQHTGRRVECDGKVITGKSAGTAMEFAFRLVAELFGDEKVTEINAGIFARL
jgi:4-methyl-5(b-hydroxyethyl)-thiazole monophosphate biosynthesis